MKKLIIIFSMLISVFLAYLIFRSGMSIEYAKQKVLIDDVRNISAIIFGVTGAWLALVYPKALASAKHVISEKEIRLVDIQQAEHDNIVLLGFIKTLLISVVIIMFTLGAPFVKEMLAQISTFLSYREYFRAALFLLLFCICLLQVYLLWGTFNQSRLALLEIKQTIAEARTKHDRLRNASF